MYVCMRVYISLSLYIYIYIYIYTSSNAVYAAVWKFAAQPRKQTNGKTNDA